MIAPAPIASLPLQDATIASEHFKGLQRPEHNTPAIRKRSEARCLQRVGGRPPRWPHRLPRHRLSPPRPPRMPAAAAQPVPKPRGRASLAGDEHETLVSLSLRLKDLQGPVTRVKKKKKKKMNTRDTTCGSADYTHVQLRAELQLRDSGLRALSIGVLRPNAGSRRTTQFKEGGSLARAVSLRSQKRGPHASHGCKRSRIRACPLTKRAPR